MRQQIPSWLAAVIIIAVIVAIGLIFFFAMQRRPTASPEEIEQKMQIYKSYRMKGR